MKKFLAVVFILILIFMIGCGGTEEAKETYTELFVGVTQTDATEILERLKNIGVTDAIYDNETIYVIEDQADLVREQWALQGTAGQTYDSLE